MARGECDMTDEAWTPRLERVEPHSLCCAECKAAHARVAELEALLQGIANAPDDGGWNERVFITAARRALNREDA